MYEFENEKNMNSVIRIHRFGSADMCICLCKDTGAMNPPLRLTECFVGISWVYVVICGVFVRHFVGGCGCFVEC